MMYFKIIQDNHVIEVSTVSAKVDEKYHMLFVCDIDHAQFIQSRDGNNLYHDSWLRPVKDVKRNYEEAEIATIDQNEYDELVALLDDGESVPIIEEIVEEPQVIAQEEPATVEEKPMSISEMRGKIKELEELVAKLTSVLGSTT